MSIAPEKTEAPVAIQVLEAKGIDDCLRKHHTLVRMESVRLETLMDRVHDKHAGSHPELEKIRNLFRALRHELAMHMVQDEQVLFPCISRLERTVQRRRPAPECVCSTLANPIHAMIHEHEDAASLLKAIRKLSNGYVPPADSSSIYRDLYDGLKGFERDLHHHIHLENTILFPRAVEMEEGARKTAADQR